MPSPRILAIPVETHPYTVGPHAGKGQLGIGGNRGREEAYLTGQVEQVVDAEVAIAPQHHLAPFKIDKTGAQPVGIFQFVAHLGIGHRMRFLPGIDRAMLTGQVALIGNKQDGL